MSRDIPVNLIERDEARPRQHFASAALFGLAQSIAANGLAVPILVRPAGERFIIVHGERRYRAVRSLGHETIAADVCNMSVDEAHWLALVENIQRAALSPIEEARAYQARLAEGLTQEALGQRLGKTQSYIATKLRFLQLPEQAQIALHTERITEGHAKQLLHLDDPKGILALLDDILREQRSVRSVDVVIGDYYAMRKAEHDMFGHLHSIAIQLKAAYDRLGLTQWSWWVHDHVVPHGVIRTEDMAIIFMAEAQHPAPTSRENAPDIYFDLLDNLMESISRDKT